MAADGHDIHGVAPKEAFLGISALTVWIMLFLGGILVDTKPFRDRLQQPEGLALQETISTGTIVLLFYTVTNIAILCCLASVMGAVGRRARLGVDDHPEPAQDNVNPYLSALFRGFFIYLALVSGLLILIESPFERLTWQTYLRLAGSLSLIGFVASYNPSIFGSVMFRANSLLDPAARQSNQSRADAKPRGSSDSTARSIGDSVSDPSSATSASAVDGEGRADA